MPRKRKKSSSKSKSTGLAKSASSPVRKKRRTSRKPPKVKSRNSTQNYGLMQAFWSVAISIFGVLAICYLLFWYVIPSLLPVERGVIAIYPSNSTGQMLLIGLSEDLERNQAVLLNHHTEDLQVAKLSHQLGLIVNKVYILEESWPENVTGSVVASSIREEVLNQFVQHRKISPDLLLSWYLVRKDNSYSEEEDLENLSTNFQKTWGSALLAGDDCQIAVLNSTDVSGLAGGMTELIEKNGGVVIRLKQYTEFLEQSTIYVDDTPACQAVVESLQDLFINPPLIQSMEVAQGSYRAPLVVILGSDYLESIN